MTEETFPPGRPRARGSFARSMFGAAARGTGLIAVAVAIGIVLLQYSDDPPRRLAGGTEPKQGAPVVERSTSTTSTTAGPRSPSEVTVVVLNASGRNKQAGPMSERLAVVGYKTLEPGNAPVRPETTVSCTAGLEREATALVAATGLPAETAELAPDSDLPGADQADCAVVIGSR